MQEVPTISKWTKRLLQLSMLKGVGPVTLIGVVDYPRFESVEPEELAVSSSSIRRALETPGAWDKAFRDAEEQIHYADMFGARIISALDEGYPYMLARKEANDPVILYVRGQLQNPKIFNQQSKFVAVVGTREPTKHGYMVTDRITERLVKSDWSIVSGLALGLDAVAHTAALDARGHTVAVMAHGLHTVAPRRHIELADRIVASGGALVSQYPFLVEPEPHLFVQRDRTQAGISHAVVMMQSGIPGGSLHAARAAIEYGRPLIVPRTTEHDRTALKAKANVLLETGTPEQKAELLKCKPQSLDNLMILRSNEDYPQMFDKLNHSVPE